MNNLKRILKNPRLILIFILSRYCHWIDDKTYLCIMYFIYFGLILFSFCVGRLTKVKIVFFLIISLFLQCLLLKISGSLDFEYLSLIGNGDYSDYVQGEWGLNYGWNAKNK